MKSLEKFITSLEKLADVVYQTLGDGFSEDIYQRALAFEFRDKGIDYLRETNRDKIAYKLKVNKPADTQIMSWLVENIHPNKLIYTDAKVRRKLSSNYFCDLPITSRCYCLHVLKTAFSVKSNN